MAEPLTPLPVIIDYLKREEKSLKNIEDISISENRTLDEIHDTLSEISKKMDVVADATKKANTASATDKLKPADATKNLSPSSNNNSKGLGFGSLITSAMVAAGLTPIIEAGFAIAITAAIAHLFPSIEERVKKQLKKDFPTAASAIGFLGSNAHSGPYEYKPPGEPPGPYGAGVPTPPGEKPSKPWTWAETGGVIAGGTIGSSIGGVAGGVLALGATLTGVGAVAAPFLPAAGEAVGAAIGGYIGERYGHSFSEDDDKPDSLGFKSGDTGDLNPDDARSFIVSKEGYGKAGHAGELYNSEGDPTIGVGHKLTPEELSSGMININDSSVSIHTTLTKEQMDKLFDQDFEIHKQRVVKELGGNTRLWDGQTKSQKLALFDYVYNGGKISKEMLDAMLSGHTDQVAEILKNTAITSHGKVLNTLIRRRNDDAKLYAGKFHEGGEVGGFGEMKAAVEGGEWIIAKPDVDRIKRFGFGFNDFMKTIDNQLNISNMNEIEKLIISQEGWKNRKYGHEIGVGHRITRQEEERGYILAGQEKIPINKKLTDREVKTILDNDIESHAKTAMREIGHDKWESLSTEKKTALIDYVFNVGHLPHSIIEAVKEDNFTKAAKLIEHSATTSHGHHLAGLVKRREKEAELISSGSGGAAAEYVVPVMKHDVPKLIEYSDKYGAGKNVLVIPSHPVIAGGAAGGGSAAVVNIPSPTISVGSSPVPGAPHLTKWPYS